jgi:hypothetical protein
VRVTVCPSVRIRPTRPTRCGPWRTGQRIRRHGQRLSAPGIAYAVHSAPVYATSLGWPEARGNADRNWQFCAALGKLAYTSTGVRNRQRRVSAPSGASQAGTLRDCCAAHGVLPLIMTDPDKPAAKTRSAPPQNPHKSGSSGLEPTRNIVREASRGRDLCPGGCNGTGEEALRASSPGKTVGLRPLSVTVTKDGPPERDSSLRQSNAREHRSQGTGVQPVRACPRPSEVAGLRAPRPHRNPVDDPAQVFLERHCYCRRVGLVADMYPRANAALWRRGERLGRR